MKRNCCICLVGIEDENAPILTMGAYGNPKCLCPECAALVDTATSGKEYDAITAAMDDITAKMSKANIDDRVTVNTMTQLLADSAERAQKIKEGTYDFALDEMENDEEGFDDIPEELQETEEDRLLDKKEEEANAKFDKVLNWMWIALGVVALFVIGWKIAGFLM